MAIKSSTVRGTPIRHIGTSGTRMEGVGAKMPPGFSGTVNPQFEGDQKGNRQVGIASGTPYDSKVGNSAEFNRTVSTDRYGMVHDQNGDQNNPHDNGDGVVLDKMTRDGDYLAGAEPTMDSPVMRGAPALAKGAVHRENMEHLGQGIGASPAQAQDDILNIRGVMSRGLDDKYGIGDANKG